MEVQVLKERVLLWIGYYSGSKKKGNKLRVAKDLYTAIQSVLRESRIETLQDSSPNSQDPPPVSPDYAKWPCASIQWGNSQKREHFSLEDEVSCVVDAISLEIPVLASKKSAHDDFISAMNARLPKNMCVYRRISIPKRTYLNAMIHCSSRRLEYVVPWSLLCHPAECATPYKSVVFPAGGLHTQSLCEGSFHQFLLGIRRVNRRFHRDSDKTAHATSPLSLLGTLPWRALDKTTRKIFAFLVRPTHDQLDFLKLIKRTCQKFQGHRSFHNFTVRKHVLPQNHSIQQNCIRFKMNGAKVVDEIGDCLIFSLTVEKYIPTGMLPRMMGIMLGCVRGLLPVEAIDTLLKGVAKTQANSVEAGPVLMDLSGVSLPVDGGKMLLSECMYHYWERKQKVVVGVNSPRGINNSKEDTAHGHEDDRETPQKKDLNSDGDHSGEENLKKKRKGIDDKTWRSTTEKFAPSENWASNMLNFRGAALRNGARSWRDLDQGSFMQNFDVECTRLATRLAKMTSHGIKSESTFSPAPEIYRDVLRRLRLLRKSGLWPKSSKGRAMLIQNKKKEDQNKNAATFDSQNEVERVSEDDADLGGGTFTIGCMPHEAVNETDVSSSDASALHRSRSQILHEPRANILFPALMKAIFELERAIMPDRPPSACCAVNCCAKFMPHTDSGAGNGQQISCIVALGDFSGGDLAVEGEVYDVRYAPFEFDGWKERHWTLPFTGERFSLVWFTPLGCSSMDTGLSLSQVSVPSSSNTLTLSNGVHMPRCGLGTFRLKGSKCENIVKTAIECGYQLIDTAEIYSNAAQVRSGIESASLSEPTNSLRNEQEKVFLVSKLSPRAMVAPYGAHVRKSFMETCAKLGRKTLDLYLMHWVAPHGMGPEGNATAAAESRAACWLEMESLYYEGYVRAIGVSNFTIDHLKQLIENPLTTVVPHVNQVEAHPLYPQHSLRAWCHSRGILITAYASLGQGSSLLLERQEVHRAATLMHCSPAQCLLAWALFNGMAIIPKSASGETRLVENKAAAELLSDTTNSRALHEGMRILDSIATPGDGAKDGSSGTLHKFAWDPSAF